MYQMLYVHTATKPPVISSVVMKYYRDVPPSHDLQNMVAKYHETAAAADKERRSPYCDKAYVMRCERIMAKLEQSLARNGIKVR